MMKMLNINILACAMCVGLFSACEKQTEPAKTSESSSALVVIKVAEPEKAHVEVHEAEHKEHGDEKESEHRELGAHVHGAASMSLVLENSLVNITMSIPGMDAVGFEHPAVSTDEQATLQKALTHLQNPDALFLLSKSADCHLLNGTVETALLNKEAKPGTHADVDISYQWQCKTPEDLKQVSVQLFTHFEHLQNIHASWISPTKQGAAELTKDNAVLSFE